jgi:hypothetical protein
VLVYDSSLDHQHSSLRKFSKRWFGPYIVWKVFEDGTYGLQEMDGTMIKNLIARKDSRSTKNDKIRICFPNMLIIQKNT